MYSKYYREPNISRSMQSSFLGLNKNARISNGEFSDMLNMSGDHVPLLSPRKPRVIAQKQVFEEITDDEGNITTEYKRLNGILGDVGFCAVWGSDFYYMGNKVEGITLVDGEKKMLAMGAYILIYPDTVYYNTVTGECGNMDTGTQATAQRFEHFRDDYEFSFVGLDATKLPCNLRLKGDAVGTQETVTFNDDAANVYTYNCQTSFSATSTYSGTGDTYRERNISYNVVFISILNGYLYYLSDADIYVTYGDHEKYSVTNAKWTKLTIDKVRLPKEITIDKIGFTDNDLERIWKGDVHVKISKSDGYYYIHNDDIANVLSFYNKYEGDDGYGTRRMCCRINTTGWVSKNLPVLDYVCVHENRLWGCRYGTQVNSWESVNEIYCSALGDFKTWTLSSDTSTLAGDPYTVGVGDYGKFTGCISHRGYVLFFKDDVVYRVSGTKPYNFQITKISESGLQSGCEKSLEIIDEVLYYKSRNGVFAYDGSLPQRISDSLGSTYYTDAVAGKLFHKYYITMKSDGERKLYVYDTKTGLWHAEDGIEAQFFTEYDGALYAGVGNDIVCLSGTPSEIFTDTEGEGEVTWYAETGDIGLNSPYQKYFHRLLIRMDMDMGARVTVELQCDSRDRVKAMDFTAAYKRSVLMPIVTPRCDHMRLRISGKGSAKIYSVSYETETVGERPMGN